MSNKLDLNHIKAITSVIDHNEIHYLSERIDFNMYDFVNDCNKFGIKDVWSNETFALDHVYVNRYDDYDTLYKSSNKIRNRSLYK